MVFKVINSDEGTKYAMSEERVIPWRSPWTPGPVADALTELLREGAACCSAIPNCRRR